MSCAAAMRADEVVPVEAWRVLSKFCCGQKWILRLCLLFILFLMISVMMITLPLPLPGDIDQQSSQAMSSTGDFRSRLRIPHSPPAASFQQHLPHIRSSTRRISLGKDTSENLASPKNLGDVSGNDKNSIKARGHAGLHRNELRIRIEMTDAIQSSSHHHLLSDFTINNLDPKHILKPGNHSTLVKQTAQTHIHLERSKSTVPSRSPADPIIISVTKAAQRQTGKWWNRHRNRNADRQTEIHESHSNAKLEQHHQALEKHPQATKHSGKSDNVGKEQLPIKNSSRNSKKYYDLSEDPPEMKRAPGPLDHKISLFQFGATMKKDDSNWCGSFKGHDFPDSDRRRIRVTRNPQPLPWLSEDDILKMELLARGEVVSKARVPAHGQILQVALDSPVPHKNPQMVKDSQKHGAGLEHTATHSERCQQGYCSLIKRTSDWFEVFAFHLDRVLGLNRSLPAVLRTFHSDILPYQYISGTPRPAVWWDPDIQHLADKDNDQNSVPLNWVQYQKLLQAKCGNKTDLRSEPCVGVQHSEWGRLALYDFLLQVNDRLDRYCCGFRPDPTELCVENLLHIKCGSSKDLLLVHILVRGTDPSKLVFIDNAGRPEQSTDNLNFRLVEGIDEFPERAVSVLHSGCLQSLLLHSLYTDKEFWDSHGGATGLRPLVHMVEQRGKILLKYIRDKNLQFKRDL